MAKQLVVVVHGVGVKESGVSADLLATALENTPEINEGLDRNDMNAARLRPHSSDDFHLREKIEYNVDGKRQVFPARIRRYKNSHDGNGSIVKERVVADFYWGDISNIASGLAGLLLGILKTILGLCHMVRENAQSVFPGAGVNSWLRKIARSAALTIHGPIAAINIVLILGVLVNGALGAYVFENKADSSTATPWIIVLVTVIGAIQILRKSDVYLTRLLGVWLLVIGLILATLTIALPSVPDVSQENNPTNILSVIDTALRVQVCNAKELDSNDKCIRGYQEIFAQGLRLLGLMGIAWVWVIVANIIIVGAELRRLLGAGSARTPSIVSATIALMSILWIIMIAAVWGSISRLPFKTLPENVQLQPILGTAGYAIFAILAVAVAGGLVFWSNQRWASNFKPSQYVKKEQPSDACAYAEKNRIIIAPKMLVFLWLFLAIFTFTTIAATLFLTGNLQTRAGWLTPFENYMHLHFVLVMTVLAAISSAMIAMGQQQLRAGLGIAIDVITWLNDNSWISSERNTVETRLLIEGWFPTLFSASSGTKNQGYWRKERIKNRLKVLMEKLISDEQPNEIIFVSHSQGTVVAIDVLNEMGVSWLQIMPENATIKLVTMGSPYIHVHRHYFPHAFPAVNQMQNLSKRQHLALTPNDGILTDWINIFRIDDFVGTHIDPAGVWPREHAVAANGHTNYWIDENVFPILKEFV